jgi:hypothetical protein
MQNLLKNWKNNIEDISSIEFLKEKSLFFKDPLKEGYSEERLENFLDFFLLKHSDKLSLPETYKTILTTSLHSIFEYKKNFFNKYYLQDLKTSKKYFFTEKTLLPNDVFSGRLLSFQDQYFLLPGVLHFPKEIKPYVKKSRISTLEWEFILDKFQFYKHLPFKKFLESFYPWVI